MARNIEGVDGSVCKAGTDDDLGKGRRMVNWKTVARCEWQTGETKIKQRNCAVYPSGTASIQRMGMQRWRRDGEHKSEDNALRFSRSRGRWNTCFEKN